MHFYEALPPETPHLPWNLPCSLSACAPPSSTKTNKNNRFSLSVRPMNPQGFAPWSGASDFPRWCNLDALDMNTLIRKRDAGVLGGAPLASKWPCQVQMGPKSLYYRRAQCVMSASKANQSPGITILLSNPTINKPFNGFMPSQHPSTQLFQEALAW